MKMKIKGNVGQHLNMQEVLLINNLEADGFLLFDTEIKRDRALIRYNTNGLVKFPKYLKRVQMTKKLFVVLLQSIVITLRSIEDNRFSRDLLVWDINSCYVDPSTARVYMMYIPLQPYEVNGSMKSFLVDFISACCFDSDEDLSYVQSLMHQLNNHITFTRNQLETYCDRLSDSLLTANGFEEKISCLVCGSLISSDVFKCPFCATQIRENKTSSFGQADMNIIHQPEVWLENSNNGDRIVLNNSVFRLGKSDDLNDYCIKSPAVSRKHAEIIGDNGSYYIVDLGSTNGTYVDDQKIEPGMKVILRNNSQIRIANSLFVFRIN